MRRNVQNPYLALDCIKSKSGYVFSDPRRSGYPFYECSEFASEKQNFQNAKNVSN